MFNLLKNKVELAFYYTGFIFSIFGLYKICKGNMNSFLKFFTALIIFLLSILVIHFTKWFYKNNKKIKKKDIEVLIILNGFAISTIPNLLNMHDIIIEKSGSEWLILSFLMLPLMSLIFFIWGYFNPEEDSGLIISWGMWFLALFFVGFIFFIVLLIIGNIFPTLFLK